MAGVELATAYVSLVVSGDKVAPGVRKALGSADGEAVRAGDKAGKSFTSRFGSALKIGATLAGAFAVTKGVQFLGDAIDEAREASVVTARTANVIKSMGNVAGISAGQVADLSGAISNKVGIDDEAIQSGANLLLTFGNLRDEVGKGNDIFTQTTGLMVDMSKAMDQDMKSSAVMLGKAMNDPIKGLTALSRVGVSFTEQQKEQITSLAETGETMKAQKIILGELKRQFGGAAETMATPAEKAEVAWGNLKEQIGEKLLPTVDRVLTWFSSEGVPAVAKFVDQFDKGKGVGGEVRDVIEDIAGAARTAAGHAADFVGWFRDMPGWAQKAMAGGAAAAFMLPKIPGASALGGGAAKGLGGLIGSSKPVPVFVTNPGALGAPGAGGIGGSKGGGKGIGAGGKLGGLGMLGALGAGAGMLAYDPKELGWDKLEGDLIKVNEAFVDIARSRTGIQDLGGATKALDGILAGMTLDKPRQGFNALWNLSQKTGISMGDLRDVLPQTNKAIQESGVKARGSARETGRWLDTIIGTGKAVDQVDGKKPSVPWKFPDLTFGIAKTGELGRDVDNVNKKNPSVKFTFPDLTFGVIKTGELKRNIEGLHDKSITITTHYRSDGRAVSSAGGHEAKASGGPVMAGQMYKVGEVGPEYIVPNVNSRVIPSNQRALVRASEGNGSGGGLSERDVQRIAEAVRAGAFGGTRAGMDQQRSLLTAARATGR